MSLRAGHASLSTSHAALDARLKIIEEFVNDKHAAELEALRGVHTQIQTEQASKHSATAEQLDEIFKNCRCVDDRIVYLERVIGDFADMQSRELSSLNLAHSGTSTQVRDVMHNHVALQ